MLECARLQCGETLSSRSFLQQHLISLVQNSTQGPVEKCSSWTAPELTSDL